MRNTKLLVLFALIAIFSLVIGHYAFTPYQCLLFVRHGGYWAILATVALFVFFLYRSLKHWIEEEHPFSRQMLASLLTKRFIGTLLLLVGVFAFIRLQEPTEFKIVMDEPALVGTSMSMHQKREVLLPTRAHRILGAFTILNGYVDKRPTFFPFLVSVVHDITGYRMTNGFVVNFILTGVFVVLAYITGQRLTGRHGGILLVLLFATLPLLIRTANGAGFELLNMVMILATMLASIAYLKDPNERTISLLCLSAVLLAQVRYESVVYILPVGLVILLGWWQKRQVIAPWVFLITPLLLIPYLWQHKTFEIGNELWQLEDRPNNGSPFSLSYFSDNLGHAINFFFDPTHRMPNSLIISGLGLITLIFFVVHFYKMVKDKEELTVPAQVFAIFVIGFFAHFVLLMSYFFGQLDDMIIRRLALPLHIPLALSIIWFFGAASTKLWMRRGLFWAIFVYLVTVTVPTTADRIYSRNYIAGQEMNWIVDYVKKRNFKDEHYCVISEQAVLWIINEIDAINNERANRRKRAFKAFIAESGNPTVYVHQSLEYDPLKKEYVYGRKSPLDEAYIQENYIFRNIHPLRRVTFNRLVDVAGVRYKPKKAIITDDDYMAEWAKNLP